MKTTTLSTLALSVLCALAATPAAAQSSVGRAEQSDSQRTNERDREPNEARSRERDTRPARDESSGTRRDSANRDSANRDSANRDSANRDSANRDAANRDAHEPAQDAPEGAASTHEGGAPAGAADGTANDAPARAAERTSGTAPRSWLARGSGEPESKPPEAESGPNAGLTLGAVLLVLGLAAAAIAMRFRKRDNLPLAPSEARLTVLSSSRVGPKAFAVTAHVNGKVLLLGVTDHTVTNLGWLDARDTGAADIEPEPAPEAAPEDELPDDYPGSALRAAKLPTFASSSRLERFQEVLRGAEEARADLPMRPSYAPGALDAASMLAAQTTDVVSASAPSAKTLPPAAVSLRRKRRPRESLPPREPRATLASRAPKGADPSLEGQVAGLRSLRNG